MPVRSVHDRDELAELLGRDRGLHAYELGDLDDFFWPYTNWYGEGDAVALLYHRTDPPTLLALGRPAQTGRLAGLLAAMLPVLPRRFHAHLSAGLEGVLAEQFEAEAHGPHLKLALTDAARLAAAHPAPAGTEPLSPADLPEIAALYATSYAGAWFDQRMLETGQYVGVRREGELLAVAGVHVWSPRYRVAALGNVATHPRVRNQGLARSAVAALCRRLLDTVDHIGLNVMAENLAARAVYSRLGFTPAAEYGEFVFTARRD